MKTGSATFMMPNNTVQSACMKFCMKFGKSAAKTLETFRLAF